MVSRVILLALEEDLASGIEPAQDPTMKLYGYRRFGEELVRAGFAVEIANEWPGTPPGDYWLFVHVDGTQPRIAEQIKQRYGANAGHRTVAFNLTYPHGFRAVNAGVEISVGMEAYADWLRGKVAAEERENFVIVNRRRAEARDLSFSRVDCDAVMLQGGPPLPQLLWKCLSV